jgi:hypothetical protein
LIVAALPITQNGRRAGRAILGDHPVECARVDLIGVVDRHLAQRVRAEAERLDRFLHAAVHLDRCVREQPLFRGRDALAPHVESCERITRDRQADEVGHRTAAHQQAARVRGESDDLLAPLHDLRLDVVRHVVAAADIRIDDRREKIGYRRERRAVAHEPRPETRVRVADRVRQHQFLEIGIGRFGAERLARCRALQACDDGVRHRLPDRAFTDGLQVVEAVVDRAVGQNPE